MSEGYPKCQPDVACPTCNPPRSEIVGQARALALPGSARQLSLIASHLDAMLPGDEAERIGATRDRALHIRVLRVLDHYEEMRAALLKIAVACSALSPNNHLGGSK